MKTALLDFITSQCENNGKAVCNRFCTYLEIYTFRDENGLTEHEMEGLLKELYREKKISFGKLLNGYFIRIKQN